MDKNPFKFGSIVEGEYFANRSEEIKKVKSILRSENHLIIISPRRYGKTSLINKVAKELKRPHIAIDLQVITAVEDFAAELLKRVYRLYSFEKIKQIVKNFRIVPEINVNPLTNHIDVSFKPVKSHTDTVPFEDVLNLIENLASPANKTIIIFDEFQEVKRIASGLERHMRSFMQLHKNINYVFLGSQESLIREIFEKKKSPFYHFGYLLPLSKIPENEFRVFLESRFKGRTGEAAFITEEILKFTRSHPYYTQELAFEVWELLDRDRSSKQGKQVVKGAEMEIVRHHDIDYERLWNTLNRTDMKILIGMAFYEGSPLSLEFIRMFNVGAQSTVFSGLKRLMQSGFISRNEKSYEMDDPFFKKWIQERRLQ